MPSVTTKSNWRCFVFSVQAIAWQSTTKPCTYCIGYPSLRGHISMGQCKKDVTPMLTHWSYVFLAPTQRYGNEILGCKFPKIFTSWDSENWQLSRHCIALLFSTILLCGSWTGDKTLPEPMMTILWCINAYPSSFIVNQYHASADNLVMQETRPPAAPKGYYVQRSHQGWIWITIKSLI